MITAGLFILKVIGLLSVSWLQILGAMVLEFALLPVVALLLTLIIHIAKEW